MQKLFVLCLFYIITVTGHTQQFGANPSGIRWRQINTDTVRVVFPSGLEARAQRVAATLHRLQKEQSATIGEELRKVSIVLHNQTLISNAYVGLAPYRSEFYLTPLQDPFRLGSINWVDNLSIHEFRHVQQYSNFNKGLSRVASVILGQEGQAVANAASIPDWFFEGDAVFNETGLSTQGRGMLPLFLGSYHALSNAGKQYSYQQLRNGSLRKYIPDHYDLGYLLVAYGRKQYGADIWRKVTDDAARFKPLLYPFQGAVKRNMGISFPQFVDEALGYYRRQWNSEVVEQPGWLTGLEKNHVNDYRYPYVMENGSVLVLKSSLRKIPAFYEVHPDKTETKIAVREIAVDDYFSYKKGMIVFAAYQPDARWGYREFTQIRTLDIATGEERTIAARTKYFSPDISSDHSQVIAVSIDPLMRSTLVLMDNNGERKDSVKHDGLFYSHPKFAPDDRHYYVAARNDAGEMALMKYGSGEDTLVGFSDHRIGYLTVRGDTVLFTMSNGQRDEIWALIDGKQRKGPYRLASYSTGLYQAGLLPSGKLVASAFTADGYRLATFTPDWNERSGKQQTTPLYVGEAYREADHSFLQNIHAGNYPVSKYARSHKLINIHSWRPYYENPEFSFTLYGQNVLNTLQTEFAYTYNENESSHKLGAAGIFGGSYVQPLVGISQTWNRTAVLNADTLVNWNELAGYAGLQLPLNLSGGRQYRYLMFSGTFHLNNVKWTGLAEKLLSDRQVNYLNMRVSYTGQVQKAVQQIYPHWAQTMSLQYRAAVNGYTAHQFLGTGSVYLPGLFNSHSIVLSAAYHARDTASQYLFSNDFPFARGYREVDFPRMWRLSANYHLPLVYPDWGFAQIVYFLRVRANLFYDYSRGRSLRTGMEYPFNTVGTEVYFDTRWWNQQPVTFGVRYSRLLDREYRGPTQPNVWELVLPVNLF